MEVLKSLTPEACKAMLSVTRDNVRNGSSDSNVTAVKRTDKFITKEGGNGGGRIPDGIILRIPSFDEVFEFMSKMENPTRDIYIVPMIGEVGGRPTAVSIYTSQFTKSLYPLVNSAVGSEVKFTDPVSVKDECPDFYDDWKWGCELNIKTFLDKYAGSLLKVNTEEYNVLAYQADKKARKKTGDTIAPKDVTKGILYKFTWEQKVEAADVVEEVSAKKSSNNKA